MAKMKANQQALQKQLEEMRKAMEKGKKPGEKPGEKNPGGMGMPGMSQQLANGRPASRHPQGDAEAWPRAEQGWQRRRQPLNKLGRGDGEEREGHREQEHHARRPCAASRTS
jgi:hypothetical protein